MKLKIELYNNSKKTPTSTSVQEQPEPDWNLLLKRAKQYGFETKTTEKDGKVVRYEEIYPRTVLGCDRYVITVEES